MDNNKNIKTFETTSRILEQVLWSLFFEPVATKKNPYDGMTVWVFEETEELKKVLEIFPEYMERREKVKSRNGRDRRLRA